MRLLKRLFLFFLLSFLIGCSHTIPETDPAADPVPSIHLPEEQKLDQLNRELVQALDRYEASHPADVSFPFSAIDNHFLYPNFLYRDETAYGIISQNIAFEPVSWEEEKHCYALFVYGLTPEKERWLREQILTADVFAEDFQLISIENDPAAPDSYLYSAYFRDPPSKALQQFYQGLQNYEREHPGSVTVSWKGPVRIRPAAPAAIREILISGWEDNAHGCHVSVLLLSDKMETWLREEICSYDQVVYTGLGEPGIPVSLQDFIQDTVSLSPSDIQETSDPGYLTIQVQRLNSYCFTDDPLLPISYSNQSGSPIYYAGSFLFDILIDGVWYTVPFVYGDNPSYGSSEPHAAYCLEGGSTNVFYLNLCQYAALIPGTYRITKTFYSGQDTLHGKNTSLIIEIQQ